MNASSVVSPATVRSAYAAAGVNLELGDAASQLLYTAAQQTWEQRQDRIGDVIIPQDDFSGVRYISVGALPADTVMGIGFDGVGTKMEIAERMQNWQTVAFDIFIFIVVTSLQRRPFETSINCLSSTGLPQPLNRLHRQPKHDTTQLIPSDGFNEK